MRRCCGTDERVGVVELNPRHIRGAARSGVSGRSQGDLARVARLRNRRQLLDHSAPAQPSNLIEPLLVDGEHLLRRHGRHAGLRDLDPRRVVRELGRLRQRAPRPRAPSPARRSPCRRRGDVVDLARDARNRSEPPSSSPAACHPRPASAAGCPPRAGPAPRAARSGLEVHRRAERGLELAAVRLEHRRARVLEEIPVLGVDHHRDAPPACRRDHAAMSCGREHALVVVLQHQRIGVGQGVARAADQPVEIAPSSRASTSSSMRTTCWERAMIRVLVVVGRPATVPRGDRRAAPPPLLPDRGAVGVVPDHPHQQQPRPSRRRWPRRWPRRPARASARARSTTGTGASGESRRCRRTGSGRS